MTKLNYLDAMTQLTLADHSFLPLFLQAKFLTGFSF